MSTGPKRNRWYRAQLRLLPPARASPARQPTPVTSDENKNTQAKGNETFVYWKGGKDNSRRGATDVKTGQFIDFDIDGEKSPCGIAEQYYYQTTLRYTEGMLEYIKVERIAKGKSMYWR